MNSRESQYFSKIICLLNNFKRAWELFNANQGKFQAGQAAGHSRRFLTYLLKPVRTVANEDCRHSNCSYVCGVFESLHLDCNIDNSLLMIAKMDSKLFVPVKLTFSEYLRYLNFPLLTFWPAKTKQVSEGHLFWDMAPTRSGIFKHLKFSENDKFTGTNSVDSILPYLIKIVFVRLLMKIWFQTRIGLNWSCKPLSNILKSVLYTAPTTLDEVNLFFFFCKE